MWLLSFPPALLGIAVLTNFKGIASRFYSTAARSWNKSAGHEGDYEAAWSFNGYRYVTGIAFCGIAVLIGILYGLLGGR